MQVPSIDFFFDFNSTYSYLADARIEAVARESGAAVCYRPMNVLQVMKAAGNAPTPSCAAKFRYNWIDARRWAADYGVELVENPFLHTLDTRPLGRMALGAERAGWLQPVKDALFRGIWADGSDLGDREVIRQTLSRASIDADRALSWATDDDLDKALRLNTEEAVRRGAFGAPTFYVGGEMYFGNDRLPFIERALQRRTRDVETPA